MGRGLSDILRRKGLEILQDDFEGISLKFFIASNLLKN
jgi:hypothetical protein